MNRFRIWWRQLRVERSRRKAVDALLGFCLIALLAPVLANHDPLLLAVNGRVRFPAFSSDPYTELPQQDGTWHKVLNRDVDWRRFEAGFCLLAPIPYAPTDLDPANANFVSPFAEQFLETDRGAEPLPFRYRHWLGTTRTGGDLLAALIHGTRYALLIGFLAALISALIGIGLGMLAGYYGDRRLRIGRTEMLAMLLTLFIAWFEGWFLPQRDAIPANPIWWCLPLITGILLRRRQVGVRSLYVPADGIVRSLTSVFLAVPRLVWIILIGATLTPAVGLVILTIGLTGWAEFAQLTRAETLRLRNAGFAEQARAAGLRNARILFLHLLPNFASLLVLVFFYHMAGAVLAESALSFLGAGVPHEIITWGGLLQEGRQALHAWWLMLFPGCCLFLLLNSLQTVSGRKAS